MGDGERGERSKLKMRENVRKLFCKNMFGEWREKTYTRDYARITQLFSNFF